MAFQFLRKVGVPRINVRVVDADFLYALSCRDHEPSHLAVVTVDDQRIAEGQTMA
jgi:hypothetical protein